MSSVLNTWRSSANAFSTGQSLTIAPTAGNSLIAILTTQGANAVTSLQTNLAVSGVLDLSSASNNVRVYRFDNIAAGTTGITYVMAGTEDNSLQVVEVNALATGTPAYAQNIANTNGVNFVNTYPVVIPNATDFIIGACADAADVTSISPTLTHVSQLTAGLGLFNGYTGAAGSQTITYTRSASQSAPMTIVAYAAASASTFPSASSKRFNSTRHSFGLSR